MPAKPANLFQFASQSIDLSITHVMGVLNVTPDSFSDGGNFTTVDKALSHAERMLADGASVLDVGGESTRPGAAEVSEQEELDRVCPVVERLVKDLGAIVSVDTSTPKVMSESIALGAGMINDVRAFTREGAIDAVNDSDVALCIMHMQGQPDTMQAAPTYASVVDEVAGFLTERASALMESGVGRDRLMLDPGFGFGKTLAHNLTLLEGLGTISELGFPVLAGLSRKSMIGAILDKPVDERLYGSLACAVIAAKQGAELIRVHDVAETMDAIKIVNALKLNQAEN